jgi:Protein of unknown function (DUF5818)
MKRGIALFALGSALALMAVGADFSGYIIDESCSSKPAMRGNEACARKCIKGGSPAVLLSADNKVYKLDDQAKVSEHAGHKVKVTGTLNGDTIKVDTINIDSGCIPGPTGCQ